MDTYTYATSILLTNASNIALEATTIDPTPSGIVIEDSVLTNLITTDFYAVPSFPALPLPTSATVNSVTGGFGTTFGDSVYSYVGAFTNGLNDYNSTSYLLVTTAIDAGIALLPQTTLEEIAIYNYAVTQRAAITTAFNAANYTEANKLIILLTNLIEDGVQNGATLTFVLSLTGAGVTINSAIANTEVPFIEAGISPPLYGGGYLNYLTNTLTDTVYQYTWNFTLNSGTSQNNNVTQTSVYPDGVYENYSSVITSYNDSGDYPAILNTGTSRLLVTTGIDLGIPIWQAAFNALVNPTPTQIADNAILETIQADIDDAYAANLFSTANDLILQAQTILAGGIGIVMYLNLATTGTKAYKEANMLNYFVNGTLPSGTYSNQVSTLTNTITNEEWNFPSAYPANATDYTEILNSNDLATLSKWTDAVYRSNVEFNVGLTAYKCLGYCLVLTSMNCVITKLTQSADSCKSLQKQLGKLVSLRQMAIDSFNAGNFTGANNAIKKFNNVTDSCNCGCR